jgi:hypothetical protein
MDKMDGWLLFSIAVSGAIFSVLSYHKSKGLDARIDKLESVIKHYQTLSQ